MAGQRANGGIPAYVADVLRAVASGCARRRFAAGVTLGEVVADSRGGYTHATVNNAIFRLRHFGLLIVTKANGTTRYRPRRGWRTGVAKARERAVARWWGSPCGVCGKPAAERFRGRVLCRACLIGNEPDPTIEDYVYTGNTALGEAVDAARRSA